MKPALTFGAFFIFSLLVFSNRSCAQQAKSRISKADTIKPPVLPDTVKVGIYITSIHDIDFRKKEYTINFWIWFKYKNKNLDMVHNLEIPRSKTWVPAYVTDTTIDDTVSILMKIQAVMKDNWKIEHFPFDKQYLRLSIENSQFDSDSLIFSPDTAGSHYDGKYVLSGWDIDSNIIIRDTIRSYGTTFGDSYVGEPHSEYSAFRVRVKITREAWGLFWKMFLTMYIAFLIAYMCFYIHADSIDSRFQLSVGALFAVIGNKYIIDSSLPESSTFTLVDQLHGLTLFFILLIISANAYSLKLHKQIKQEQADRFDMISAQALISLYIICNVVFIVIAFISGSPG